ncbi:adenylosuccinate synthetase [Aliikangiella maris]|uniref:Adenylosuccinate synthetase n=2 Tax=Aliikangiella maris TaxID=3162458 RepID=A0ABV2BX98_9GAMM
MGILRQTGHEHFNGCLVVPVINEAHQVKEVYGRKILGSKLRKGTAQHLYLPGEACGMFNLTKLDVLDGLETVKICAAYTCPENGQLNITPVSAEGFARIQPEYIELPGWSESTFGIESWDELPENARNYISKIESLIGIPIDNISTGPDHIEATTKREPFE